METMQSPAVPTVPAPTPQAQKPKRPSKVSVFEQVYGRLGDTATDEQLMEMCNRDLLPFSTTEEPWQFRMSDIATYRAQYKAKHAPKPVPRVRNRKKPHPVNRIESPSSNGSSPISHGHAAPTNSNAIAILNETAVRLAGHIPHLQQLAKEFGRETLIQCIKVTCPA